MGSPVLHFPNFECTAKFAQFHKPKYSNLKQPATHNRQSAKTVINEAFTWIRLVGCMWILLLHRQIPNSSAVVLPSLKSPPPGHGDCALQERPRPHRRRRSPWDRSTRLAEAFASEGRRSGRTRRLNSGSSPQRGSKGFPHFIGKRCGLWEQSYTFCWWFFRWIWEDLGNIDIQWYTLDNPCRFPMDFDHRPYIR